MGAAGVLKGECLVVASLAAVVMVVDRMETQEEPQAVEGACTHSFDRQYLQTSHS